MILIALSLLILLVLTGLVLTWVTRGRGVTPAAPEASRTPLPCAAIPIRFILEEPVCADKLLQAMNVTNVRILPRDAPIPGFDENGTARMRDLRTWYAGRANGTRRS